MESVPTSALDALPIFPLPQVVLFPGMLLPLHVFEPRYRDMTRQVLAGNRIMAVARLRPGYEDDYEGRPPVFDVAGVGYVVADERTEDGRYNLVLRGVGRVEIEEELPPAQAYRVVKARILGDTRTRRPEAVPGLQAQVVALCQRVAHSFGEPGEKLAAIASDTHSPATCADILAAALIADADTRQHLLEALDPADRLEVVLETLTQLLVQFGPSSDSLN